MKKLKYFLFIFVLFLTPSVFAKEINANQYTSASFNGTKNQYKATEIYNSGTEHTYNLNTRYNGTLSKIDYYIHYPFESGYTYTVTMNMATNDWRNKFMGVFVTDAEHDENTNLSNHNVTFISRQKIRFTFTTTQNVTDIKVVLYSTSVADIPFTGETNWNLSSIILDDPFYNSSSGGSSGGSGSGSTDSTNNDIINNNKQNTQDIIDNANNNTQDIINNQNENLRDYCKNLIDMPSVSEYNFYLSENLKPYTTYAFSYNGGSVSYNIYDSHNGELLNYCGTSHTCVFTTNANGTAFFNGWNGTFPLTNFMLIEGSTPTYYCKYGSYTNRLDNIGSAVANGAQSILDNANNNTQEIIDNQNENTQKQIDSQKVCTNKVIDYSSGVISNSFLSSNGTITSWSNYTITDYFKISKDTKIEVLDIIAGVSHYCFYNSNKTLLSCKPNSSLVVGSTIVIPDNTEYIRFSIYYNDKPKFNILNCKDGNQAISDILTDDTDPSIDDSELNEVFGKVHFTDPLSYLLTLPTQLINQIVSMSDSCSAIDLGTLYGVHLTLPCINLENYLGSDLWTILDVILSVGLLSVILKNFYDTISNLLTLGGEKEAKEKFSMPTPMDFLAMILGGDNN